MMTETNRLKLMMFSFSLLLTKRMYHGRDNFIISTEYNFIHTGISAASFGG